MKMYKSIVKSLGSYLSSKKTKTYLSGLVGTLISTYVLKDNPELAMKVATLIVGLASSLILAQGGADAFGSEAYHGKVKTSKKKK